MRGFDRASLEALDVAVGDAINDLVAVSLPSEDSPYHQLAAWAGSIARAQALEIFTTNYDLLIEQALEESRVPYFDGFVGARESFLDITAIEDDEMPARWVRLWKLHGSVNWRLDGSSVSRVSHLQAGSPRLVHPSHLKYDESRRMPYLAMIDRLRAFLRRRGAARFVSGYSFGDRHINEAMIQGLEGIRPQLSSVSSTATSSGIPRRSPWQGVGRT